MDKRIEYEIEDLITIFTYSRRKLREYLNSLKTTCALCKNESCDHCTINILIKKILEVL